MPKKGKKDSVKKKKKGAAKETMPAQVQPEQTPPQTQPTTAPQE